MTCSTDQALETIKQILEEVLDLDRANLREDQSLVGDLHVDSLLTMQLVAAIEQKLNIEVAPETLMTIETVGDLYRAVETLSGRLESRG